MTKISTMYSWRLYQRGYGRTGGTPSSNTAKDGNFNDDSGSGDEDDESRDETSFVYSFLREMDVS